MTWYDRLQTNLIMTSPTGIVFTADWKGDPREMDKKVGIFEYPGIPGAYTQDLDVRAVRYSLTFYFEGADHDLTAKDFFKACSERGHWTINHPTLGLFLGQLLKVREEIQPVESANITVFSTEWIEPITNRTLVSDVERASRIKEQGAVVLEAASVQFNDNVDISKPSLLTGFRSSVKSAVAIVSKSLSTVVSVVSTAADTVAKVNAEISSVHRAITENISDAALNVAALGGQLQALVTLPMLTSESIGVRLDHYSNLITNMFVTRSTNANDAATREVVVVSAIAAAANIVTDGDPKTREEAVSFIVKVNQMFADVMTGLDAAQTALTTSPIKRQFFTQSSSYNDCAILVGQVNDYLLRRLFDLATVRVITLERSRCPVEIAITENVDFDLFIESNNLSADDILLLPGGRQVVVYL